MIEIGKYNTLMILRETGVGLYLGRPEKNNDPSKDILFPITYIQKIYT